MPSHPASATTCGTIAAAWAAVAVNTACGPSRPPPVGDSPEPGGTWRERWTLSPAVDRASHRHPDLGPGASTASGPTEIWTPNNLFRPAP